MVPAILAVWNTEQSMYAIFFYNHLLRTQDVDHPHFLKVIEFDGCDRQECSQHNVHLEMPCQSPPDTTQKYRKPDGSYQNQSWASQPTIHPVTIWQNFLFRSRCRKIGESFHFVVHTLFKNLQISLKMPCEFTCRIVWTGAQDLDSFLQLLEAMWSIPLILYKR
jgi:hypothetical protein